MNHAKAGGAQLEVVKGPSVGRVGAVKDQWVGKWANEEKGGPLGTLKDQMGWRGADGDQVGRWTGGTGRVRNGQVGGRLLWARWGDDRPSWQMDDGGGWGGGRKAGLSRSSMKAELYL